MVAEASKTCLKCCPRDEDEEGEEEEEEASSPLTDHE